MFYFGMVEFGFPPIPKRFGCHIQISRIAHRFIAILRCWRWFSYNFFIEVKFWCLPTINWFRGQNIGHHFYCNVGLIVGLQNRPFVSISPSLNFHGTSILSAVALLIPPLKQSSKSVLCSKNTMCIFFMIFFISKQMSWYALVRLPYLRNKHLMHVVHLSMRIAHSTIGTRGDPKMTTRICDGIGERAQMNQVWVRALGVDNTFHPWRLGVTKVRPWTLGSLWHQDLKCSRTPNKRCGLGDMTI